MFDNDILTQDLYGVVGMHQNGNPSFPTLVPSLVSPRKKRYLQKQHPLLEVEVIDQCSKNYQIWKYDLWSATQEYKKGDQVRYSVDGLSYEYINDTPSIGNIPTDDSFFILINELSNYLINTQKQAIDNVLDYIDEERKIKGTTKTVLESVQLYDRSTDYRDTIVNQGSFVGLALKLADHRNIKAVVKNIGLQLSESVSDLNLYLYHSSQQQPLAIANIDQARDMDFIWHNVMANDFHLKYWGQNTDVGGIFYIGYYQADLGTSQACRKNYNWASSPMSGNCCKSDYSLWEAWSQYVEVHPFEVISSNINNERTLFDVSRVRWNYSNNYGINLNFSVECDLTDYIKQNESTLASSIVKEWGLVIIRDIANSFRGNKIEKQAVNLAMVAISEKNSDNYIWKVKKALKALEFDLSDLNEVCSPCRDEWGPSWGSI